MKKQFLCLLPVILILALIFSGCGGGNSSPSQPTNPTDPTNPTNPTTPVPDLPAPFSAMVRVPGATSFPTASNHTPSDPMANIVDDIICDKVNYAYYMAQTEVTYQQWTIVHNWAQIHGYTFATGGRGGYYIITPYEIGTYPAGHETDPVTTISWRDAIVWCNALTEYHNAQNGAGLECVYKLGGNPIKNANDTVCDTIAPDSNARGFRLPTNMEWELAARYKGNDSSHGAIYSGGLYWAPGSYASGATAACMTPEDLNVGEAANHAVAWYFANSNIFAPNHYSTQPVGWQKIPNALGLRDMSGNVWEWCFDKTGSSWSLRGGSWYHPKTRLQLGYIHPQSSATVTLNDAGFRFVRTE